LRKELNKLFIDVFYDLRDTQILIRTNQLNQLMSFYQILKNQED